MTTDKKTLNISDLGNLNLAKKDLAYLVNKGLPVERLGCIEIFPNWEILEDCIVLGYDHDVPICCFRNGDGIFSIEDNQKRFVNSTVEFFISTTTRFSRYCKAVIEVEDEEDALIIVHSAIDDMRKIDDIAWSNNQYYWPIISEQMIQGHL